jgi:hypothetical protein
MHRITLLPSEMEALYTYILTVQIEATYQDKASKVFQIVQASREFFGKIEARKPQPLASESLAILGLASPCRTEEEVLTSSRKSWSIEKLEDMCKQMEENVKVWCAGLVEVKVRWKRAGSIGM